VGQLLGFLFLSCRILDEKSWLDTDKRFDVVSCLNVLDRCETPLSLLNNIKRVLRSDGIAIISFVIPFKPYVEFGMITENYLTAITVPTCPSI